VYCTYGEEADDEANKVSRRPEARPAEESIVNKFFSVPVITTGKAVITRGMVSNPAVFIFQPLYIILTKIFPCLHFNDN
jgi:hypothetical protein